MASQCFSAIVELVAIVKQVDNLPQEYINKWIGPASYESEMDADNVKKTTQASRNHPIHSQHSHLRARPICFSCETGRQRARQLQRLHANYGKAENMLHSNWWRAPNRSHFMISWVILEVLLPFHLVCISLCLGEIPKQSQG